MRISKPEMYMRIAHIVAQRSTCVRINVGAVIVKDGRVISVGYNGSTPSAEHCDLHFRKIYEDIKHAHGTYEDYIKSGSFRDLHHDWAMENECHAEMNAILFAAKTGIPTSETEMYTTYSPCVICAKMIIQSGIKKLFYYREYDRDIKEVTSMFSQNKVEFTRVTI